jgi:hypothetical protein
VDPFSAPREPLDEAVPASKPDWSVLYARRAAYGVYAITLISGFCHGANPTGAVRLFTTLAAAWAIAYYCALDARAHRVVFMHSFWLITSMTWPVAPLFHFVRVRGARGVLSYVLHAALIVFCWMTSDAIGGLLRHK